MSLQLKRAQTSDINPDLVLKEGQPGVELRGGGATPPRLKIGDGTTKWSELPYCCQEPIFNVGEYSKITSMNNAEFRITQLANDRDIINVGSMAEDFIGVSPSYGIEMYREEAASRISLRFGSKTLTIQDETLGGLVLYSPGGTEVKIGTTAYPISSIYCATTDASSNNSVPNIAYINNNLLSTNTSETSDGIASINWTYRVQGSWCRAIGIGKFAISSEVVDASFRIPYPVTFSSAPVIQITTHTSSWTVGEASMYTVTSTPKNYLSVHFEKQSAFTSINGMVFHVTVEGLVE